LRKLINLFWKTSLQEIYKTIITQIKYFIKGKKIKNNNYTLDYVINNKQYMNTNVLIDRFERYCRVIKHNDPKYNLSINSFKDKNVLELGCGPLLGWGPIALFLRALSFSYHEPANIPETIKSDEVKTQYFKRLFDELKSNYSGDDKFDKFYNTVMDNSIPISFNKNRFVDFVLSNSVLEHIPKIKLELLLDNVSQLCVDKALFLHAVDFGTHGFLNMDLIKLYSIDRLKFTESKKTYNINFLRKNDIADILYSKGFISELIIDYRFDEIDSTLVHSSWDKYSYEDLRARVVLYFGRYRIS
tara:strand:- start:3252 stop:4154 length:903 start_codon:yes stop_codon:yes gene_type:complete